MTGASIPAAIVRALERAWPGLDAPVKWMPRHDPYRVLVAAVLSTRTRDQVTVAAAARLFAAAPGARALARLRPKRLEQLVYPVGFFRTKARTLPRLATLLLDRFGARVPRDMKQLLSLPGVGRKVANVVLAQAFGRPAIAVDTHVHRISNLLGLVDSRTPSQTERALMNVLPVRFWSRWNRLLVALGQTVCLPGRPHCPVCPVRRWCAWSRAGRRVRARP
ncbi:endonuclease III [candidate division WOR-3 bacterium]|nr:endonuclease III [candidate division WOR-3 bacterium]